MKDDSKVSKKDLYEKLWQSRDFELSHLWQRSIFLATFIVLLFTLYFTLLGTLLEGDDFINISQNSASAYDEYLIGINNNNDQRIEIAVNDKAESECAYIIVLCLICVIGYAFSVLWIFMARGSKYIYECHEAGINKAFEKGYFDDDLNSQIDMELYEAMWKNGINLNNSPRHGFLPSPGKYDFSTFSTDGAHYSLSRINIVVGYIFSFVWIVLFVVNFVVIRNGLKYIEYFVIPAFLLFCIIPLWFSFMVRPGDFPRKFGLKVLWKNIRGNYESPDKMQIEWIQNSFSKDPQYSKLMKKIDENLEKYKEKCDNWLQRKVIDDFISDSTDAKNIRRLLYHRETKDIFEYTIMWREGVPDQFCSKWVDESNNIRLLISKKTIVLFLDGYQIDLDLTCSNTRLYADTEWKRIRSGKKDYKLICNDEVLHVICKKNNEYERYITFDIYDAGQMNVRMLIVEYINCFSAHNRINKESYSFKLKKT